ncbi:MAG TPA: protein kinase [Planctomycetota bacterium]|nr:protein kinase [Planctomycetota bacterium]
MGSEGPKTICFRCTAYVERATDAGTCPECGGPWVSETSRVGPYRLIRLISSGPTSRVHLAWDERHDRAVALKMILEFTPRDELRLQREAKIASQLQHHHIVRILDYGTLAGSMFRILYLIMDYIDGHPLDCTPRPLAEKLRCVADISDALHYAHSHGVVHRDVKPSNILVDRDGKAYITDFGLAKPIDDMELGVTVTGSILGSPHFISPEQARGERMIGPASDIFSLGATLYQVATGRLPYQGPGSAMEVIRRTATGPPERPSTVKPEIDPRLEEVILRAMATDPQARFPDAAAMASALRSLGTKGVASPRKADPPPAPDPSRGPEVLQREAEVPLEPAEMLLALHELTNRPPDEGEFRRIEDAVVEALAIFPRHPRALVCRGRLLLARGRVDEAIAGFDDAVAAAPNLSLAYRHRARALIHKFQDLRGMPNVLMGDEDVIVHPWRNETDEQRAVRSAIVGDLQRVERTHGFGADPQRLLIAGQIDLYENRLEEAVEKLSAGAQILGFIPDGWFALALGLTLQGKFREAREAAAKANAIRRSPIGLRLEAIAGMAAGYMLRNAGQECVAEFARAAAAAEEGVRLAPEDPRFRHTRAVLLYELARTKAKMGSISNEDLSALLDAGEDVIRRAPKLTLPRETKTVSLLLCSRHWTGTAEEREDFVRRAIEHCAESAKLDPTLILPHNNLAECWLQLGRCARVEGDRRKALEEALRLTRMEMGTEEERAWAYPPIRAEALYLLGRLDEAREEARRAKVLRPGVARANPELYRALLGEAGV